MGKNKLLLIGWDAADWKIIGPLIAKGQMPALKGLIDKGVYGNLSTMNPPYSPMLWTSVATGKTPDKHGVLGFIEVLPEMEGVRPVTSNSRKVRALWNILHHNKLKSNLVGWWPSYPAEPIDGVVISNKFQKVSSNPDKQVPMDEGVIHPSDLKDEFKDLRMFPWEITKEHVLPMIPKAAKIDQEKDNGVRAFSKVTAENVSVHNAVTKLLRTTDWDFTAVYYDLIDHFCHAFMKYHPPKLDGVDQDKYDIYNDAINSAYRFQDMMLERKLQLIDDDTTVIVMSDHGYESGAKRIIDMPDVQAAPALEHRQFGMFVACGPGIKKNEKIFGLGLVDIAPTILNHFGLPIGEDMDGKVISDMYQAPTKPKYIDSWESVKGDFGELDKSTDVSALDDKETMAQLIELGYVDKPDEKIENAVHKTNCDLKHNLAKVLVGKKDYHQAEKILKELVSEAKGLDITPYYLDLVRLNLKLADYEKASVYIRLIRETETKVKYNLFFYETEILAAMGRPKEALEILGKYEANNRNPEIWFRMALLYFQVGDYSMSRDFYEKAIEFEPDTAKFHVGLAKSLIELEDFEEAVEEALVSIELVKFYPDAHYTLGRALERLGDLENAKIAYETAKALKPREFHRVDRALENVDKKLDISLEFLDKNEKEFQENQITIVSGLPRSGTSLMMQMLNKGGVDILSDNKREADVSNPKGYYEYEPVMSIHKDNSWLHLAQNKGVKVVAPLLKNLDPQYRYKVIFMKRDVNEIIRSQQIMIGKNPDNLPINIYNAFQKQLETIEKWKDREPHIELIYVDYKELIENKDFDIQKIEDFIGVPLDTKAMMSCIDKKLYRNKTTTN